MTLHLSGHINSAISPAPPTRHWLINNLGLKVVRVLPYMFVRVNLGDRRMWAYENHTSKTRPRNLSDRQDCGMGAIHSPENTLTQLLSSEYPVRYVHWEDSRMSQMLQLALSLLLMQPCLNCCPFVCLALQTYVCPFICPALWLYDFSSSSPCFCTSFNLWLSSNLWQPDSTTSEFALLFPQRLLWHSCQLYISASVHNLWNSLNSTLASLTLCSCSAAYI